MLSLTNPSTLPNNLPSFIMDRVLMKNADSKADREEGKQAPHFPDAVTGPGRLDAELLGTGYSNHKALLDKSPPALTHASTVHGIINISKLSSKLNRGKVCSGVGSKEKMGDKAMKARATTVASRNYIKMNFFYSEIYSTAPMSTSVSSEPRSVTQRQETRCVSNNFGAFDGYIG